MRDHSMPPLDRRAFLHLTGLAVLGSGCHWLGWNCDQPLPATGKVVDIHCHTFNGRDLPFDGFVRASHLRKVPQFIQILLVKPLLSTLERAAEKPSDELKALNQAIGNDTIMLPLDDGREGATGVDVDAAIMDALGELNRREEIKGGLGGREGSYTFELVDAVMERYARGNASGSDAPESPQNPDVPVGPDPDAPVAPDPDAPVGPDPDAPVNPADSTQGSHTFKQLVELELKRDKTLAKWLEDHAVVEDPGTEGVISATARAVRRVRAIISTVSGTLNLFVQPRYIMAARLALTYPQIRLMTPSLVDFDGWAKKDKTRTPLATQIKIHGQISRLFRRGWRLNKGAPLFQSIGYHGFVAFNPLTPGALGMVEDAIANHAFVGVKVYPPCGFLPLGNKKPGLDEALNQLYAWCVEQEVPILTHCNNSNGFGKRFGENAHPKHWAKVLDLYPALRLNLSHFGHMTGYKEGQQTGWAWEALEIIAQTKDGQRRYPNVYVDISNSSLPSDNDYRRRFLKMLKQLLKHNEGVLRRRICYGSDWFMNRIYEPRHDEFVVDFQNAIKDLVDDDPNLVEDFMYRNSLRYLGIVDDANIPNTNNKTRGRLLKFYKDFPTPQWLQETS